MELETDGRSPYHAIAHLARGHAAYIAGELELAATHLARSAQSETAPGLVRVLSLALHSLVEHERGRPGRSHDLAELAMGIVRRRGMQQLPQAAFAFAALGVAQAEAGDVRHGLATLADGLAARRQNPDVGPWGIIHLLLAKARVSVAAGELREGRELLAEAEERMARFDTGMDTMWERYAAVERLLGNERANGGSPQPAAEPVVIEALTDRETDVLRLLQGSLTVGEISDQLLPLHEHREDPRPVGLPQARRPLPHQAVAAARRHRLL